MSDDLISRKRLLSDLQKEYDKIALYVEGEERQNAMREQMAIVNLKVIHQPSAERHGHWKEEELIFGEIDYVCSVCSEAWTLEVGTPLENNMNYCPNCGADMRGGNNG